MHLQLVAAERHAECLTSAARSSSKAEATLDCCPWEHAQLQGTLYRSIMVHMHMHVHVHVHGMCMCMHHASTLLLTALLYRTTNTAGHGGALPREGGEWPDGRVGILAGTPQPTL